MSGWKMWIAAVMLVTACKRSVAKDEPHRTEACGKDTITIAGGCVRGEHAGGLAIYRGIPYAAPPIGGLRWKRPVPPTPWQGARDATAFGKACPQLDGTLGGKLDTDEDCLTLNVWTAGKAKRPVMVWIHGGGMVQGGSSLPAYDASHLAIDGDVVVVSINYRLGPLGFFAHPALSAEDNDHHVSGDLGIHDQIAALAWVKANIAAFGGDPANVTVFGESAGGESVCALMASPLAKGMFAHAVIESGSCVDYGVALRTLHDGGPGKESAEAQGVRIAKALGCDGADALRCLRGKTANDLVHASPASFGFLGKGEHYGLAVDGWLLPDAPAALQAAGKLAAVPTMIGTNGDEGALFVTGIKLARPIAYDMFVAKIFAGSARQVIAQYPPGSSPKQAFDLLVSDVAFTCPTRRTARALAKHQHVYRYLFSHVTQKERDKGVGAMHGSEIPFVFGTQQSPSDDERALSREMLAAWTRFAHTGDPNDPKHAAWPVYDPVKDSYYDFDTTSAARDGLHAQGCDLIDSLTHADHVDDTD